jgi:hypothetical protein
MPDSVLPYRIALSLAGGLSIGIFGLIAGAAWSLSLGADMLTSALVVGVLAFVWGAICVQLTPTGGAIMENKTTVNYAVVALHGWMTFFFCMLAVIFWAVRVAIL